MLSSLSFAQREQTLSASGTLWNIMFPSQPYNLYFVLPFHAWDLLQFHIAGTLFVCVLSWDFIPCSNLH